MSKPFQRMKDAVSAVKRTSKAGKTGKVKAAHLIGIRGLPSVGLPSADKALRQAEKNADSLLQTEENQRTLWHSTRPEEDQEKPSCSLVAITKDKGFSSAYRADLNALTLDTHEEVKARLRARKGKPEKIGPSPQEKAEERARLLENRADREPRKKKVLPPTQKIYGAPNGYTGRVRVVQP